MRCVLVTLMGMVVRETPERLEATKCQFSKENTTEDDKKETTVTSHDDHHKQVTDERGEGGNKASDRVSCPRKGRNNRHNQRAWVCCRVERLRWAIVGAFGWFFDVSFNLLDTKKWIQCMKLWLCGQTYNRLSSENVSDNSVITHGSPSHKICFECRKTSWKNGKEK